MLDNHYNFLLMNVQYAEKMYGIKDETDAVPEDSDDDDIEAAIQKEVAALNANGKSGNESRTFTPMKMNVDCLLFFKTKKPIEPVEFVRRICADAKNSTDPTQLKCRYVNRLTPVTVIGKASESGLLEVARKALAPHFKISSVQPPAAGIAQGKEEESTKNGEAETAAPQETQTPELKPSTVSLVPSMQTWY